MTSCITGLQLLLPMFDMKIPTTSPQLISEETTFLISTMLVATSKLFTTNIGMQITVMYTTSFLIRNFRRSILPAMENLKVTTSQQSKETPQTVPVNHIKKISWTIIIFYHKCVSRLPMREICSSTFIATYRAWRDTPANEANPSS